MLGQERSKIFCQLLVFLLYAIYSSCKMCFFNESACKCELSDKAWVIKCVDLKECSYTTVKYTTFFFFFFLVSLHTWMLLFLSSVSALLLSLSLFILLSTFFSPPTLPILGAILGSPPAASPSLPTSPSSPIRHCKGRLGTRCEERKHRPSPKGEMGIPLRTDSTEIRWQFLCPTAAGRREDIWIPISALSLAPSPGICLSAGS